MNRIRIVLLCLLSCGLLAAAPQKSSAAPAHLPAQAPVDYRFGVIESYQNPAEANALGAAWTRVRFQWAEVQVGGPGTWTPSVSEGQINGEIGAGRTVVGLLIGIPDWAREGRVAAWPQLAAHGPEQHLGQLCAGGGGAVQRPYQPLDHLE
jgi:hypothetical protein